MFTLPIELCFQPPTFLDLIICMRVIIMASLYYRAIKMSYDVKCLPMGKVVGTQQVSHEF